MAAGEHGAAFGAARLARMAATGETPEMVCEPPRHEETVIPDPALAAAYVDRIEQYRRAAGAALPG